MYVCVRHTHRHPHTHTEKKKKGEQKHYFFPCSFLFSKQCLFLPEKVLQTEVILTLFVSYCARGHMSCLLHDVPSEDYSALETAFFELIPKVVQNLLTPVKSNIKKRIVLSLMTYLVTRHIRSNSLMKLLLI